MNGESKEESDNLLERAAQFCCTPQFERVFDNFAMKNAHLFQDAAEAKEGDVEHKHEYQKAHEEYLELFEEEISEFLEKEGETIETFFEECRDAKEGKYTALFEEHRYAWFVERLLASLDYTQFYGLMVNEARRQMRK